MGVQDARTPLALVAKVLAPRPYLCLVCMKICSPLLVLIEPAAPPLFSKSATLRSSAVMRKSTSESLPVVSFISVASSVTLSFVALISFLVAL